MKLICLNIWGGKVYEPLKEFMIKHSKDVDIFCLQEVFDNKPGIKSVLHDGAHAKVKYDIFSDIKSWLEDHRGYIHPRQDNEESNAFFIRKNINLEKIDEVYLHGSRNSMGYTNREEFPVIFPVNMEYLTFVKNEKKYLTCNLHGHWTHDGKKDNPVRLEQSRKILDFLKNVNGAKIICGDFNLLPDTQSIKMLENSGLRNLVKEFNITSTRSPLYKGSTPFADYCFVSPDVKVKDFQVLQDVVSDHSPLYLKFN